MKKKLLFIFITSLISFTFIGCTLKLGSYTINNFSIVKKKPNNFYYINNLAKNLTLDSSIKGKLLDTNFYKEIDLSKDDIETLKNFTKALKKPNFIDRPKDLPEKPSYKIFLTFSKEKYVLNIYNDKYISVYPWDGTYPMDYLDMSNIQTHYNLFGLCKYLIPR